MNEKYIVGVDEAGCGALVGPLVVCAAAFRADAARVEVEWHSIRGSVSRLVAGDSKSVKDADKRAKLAEAIRTASPAVAVVERTAREIDERLLGTVFPEALRLAALRCLERLKTIDATLRAQDVLVIIDGDVERPDLPCAVQCFPDADKTDWRVGAASLVARATHDLRIDALHAEYPRWGFDRSRGYPTREHKALLTERGPTPAHRRSFRPVRATFPAALGIEDA